MRALSDATATLIDEVNRLASERSWPWKQATLEGEIASGLTRIGAAGEWLAIPR